MLMPAISVSIWARNSSRLGRRGDRRAMTRSNRAAASAGSRSAVAGAADGRDRSRSRRALLKEGAARAVRVEIAGPGSCGMPVMRQQRRDIVAKAGEVRVDDSIGPVGRHHPALPAGCRDRRMRSEVVERAVGGRDRLDAEALDTARAAGSRASPAPPRSCRRSASALVSAEALLDAEQRFRSACSNQSRVGVPREQTCQCARRAARSCARRSRPAQPSRLGTPRSSSRTPCE